MAEGPGERTVRIAAVGDLHFDTASRGDLADLFSGVNHDADILVLCGDLTTHGRPDQLKALARELSAVEIPIVAVLGNHDHEGGSIDEIRDILAEVGVELLDGDATTIEGVGFAGVKGFAGGFGRGTLAPFGEDLIKSFVQHSIDEALKLENALRTLTAETKVVVMHYAPIEETLVGEPETIYPYLGTSRLLPPVETHGASVVFHGHAHHGTAEAVTPAGVPVYNVALPVLRQEGLFYRIWHATAPERRRARGAEASGNGRGDERRGGRGAEREQGRESTAMRAGEREPVREGEPEPMRAEEARVGHEPGADARGRVAGERRRGGRRATDRGVDERGAG